MSANLKLFVEAAYRLRKAQKGYFLHLRGGILFEPRKREELLMDKRVQAYNVQRQTRNVSIREVDDAQSLERLVSLYVLMRESQKGWRKYQNPSTLTDLKVREKTFDAELAVAFRRIVAKQGVFTFKD